MLFNNVELFLLFLTSAEKAYVLEWSSDSQGNVLFPLWKYGFCAINFLGPDVLTLAHSTHFLRLSAAWDLEE